MEVCLPKRIMDIFYYGMNKMDYLSDKWREIANQRMFLCIRYKGTTYKVNVTPDEVTLIITAPGFNHQFEVQSAEKEEHGARCYDLALTVSDKDKPHWETIVFTMCEQEEEAERLNRWKYESS